MMKGPKNETNKTKHRQMTSGASTNAASRYHHLKKLKQCSFNPTKRNFTVEATSENKSLAQSSRATDEEDALEQPTPLMRLTQSVLWKCYPNKATIGQSKQPRRATEQQLVLSHQMQDEYFF